VHGVIADQGQFAVQQVLVNPKVNRFVKDTQIQGKEKLVEGMVPVFKEKQEGKQQNQEGPTFSSPETVGGCFHRFQR
jgi:hypothetical protein